LAFIHSIFAKFYQLPYFAPSEPLPSVLPTTAAIIGSQDVLSKDHSRKIVRVGHDFVVKHGAGVKIIKGENMVFVGQCTKSPRVRMPQVYAVYSDQDTGVNYIVNYIVMEIIVGDTLALRWGSLSTDQKEKLCTELRDFCYQLRNIPSLGYFGSLGKRGLEDPIFWTGNEIQLGLIDGPLGTEDELNNAITEKYLYKDLPSHKAEFYRRAFPVVLKNYLPVFTHSDLQRMNIMVQKWSTTGCVEEAEDGYSLIIIDWESSGWYPSYWEFATVMFSCGRWDDDWAVWVLKILDPFFNEYGWMQMLRTELWS